MRLIHENLECEARHISDTINSVLGEKYFLSQGEIINANLDDFFVEIPGYSDCYWAVPSRNLNREFNSATPMIILTNKDIYLEKIKYEGWVFGNANPDGYVVSTARLKGKDSRIRENLEVSLEHYLKRVGLLALHEVCHGVICNRDELKNTAVVNSKNGKMMWLGRHCTDNRCAFYEFIDINPPKKEEGYMLFYDNYSQEKRFDAGLDDLIKRLYPSSLCNGCLDAII